MKLNSSEKLRRLACDAITSGATIKPVPTEGKVGTLRILLEANDEEPWRAIWLLVNNDGSASLAWMWPEATRGTPACLYTFPEGFKYVWLKAFAACIQPAIDRMWSKHKAKVS